MMKRTLLIVAILALSVAPAMATVTISAIQVTPTATGGTYSRAQGKPCNAIDINFVCTTESVRAFALEVTLDNGFTFTEITDYNAGESKTVAGDANAKIGYGIYPGKFRDIVNAADPCWWVASGYNPIAPNTDVDAANTGIGTNKVILEMGTLYSGVANKPPASGRLCRLYVMPPRVPLDCNITVAVNTTRGGVVLEDGTSVTPTFVARGVKQAGKISFPKCFPCWATSATNAGYETQYAQFLTVWEPNCWCGQYAPTDTNGIRTYQCYGDTDAKTETLSKYRVYLSDYNKMVACWKNTATQLRPKLNGFCADVDHQAETLSKYRVYLSDYNRLVANWKKTDTQLKANPCPVTTY